MKKDAEKIGSLIVQLRKSGSQFDILDSDAGDRLLKTCFPIAPHGRIAWGQVSKRRICLWQNDDEAIQAFAGFIEAECLSRDEPVFVLWTDMEKPEVRTQLGVVTEHLMAFSDEDWDMWIIDAEGKWVIEKYHEGELCFGAAVNHGFGA